MNEALRLLDEAITLMRRGIAIEHDIVQLEAIRTRMVRRIRVPFVSASADDDCMVPPYVRLQRGHLGD